MTSRSLKLLVSALSLAVVLAPGVDAVAKVKRHKPAAQYAGSSSTCRGGANFRCRGLQCNDYLGDDPDSYIRLMIQRDLGAKYGGPE